LETIISEEIAVEDQLILADDCVLNKAIESKYSPKGIDYTPESQHPRHCLQMFISRELVEYFSQQGGYIVTPGWLSHWKSILKDWGFDQQTARSFFQECSTHIILLETYINSKSFENLNEFADYIGLPGKIIPVGLDHFRMIVTQLVGEWRMKQKADQSTESLNLVQQQLANYALAFDMLANLTRMMKEGDAVEEIKNLFSMLFAPKVITYISISGGKQKEVFPPQTTSEHAQKLFLWANSQPYDYHLFENTDGFLLRISHLSETLGVIEIKQIAFPHYCQQYLNMGLVLAPLCGLAISNARAYQKIEENEILLQQLASIDSLTGLHNRRYFFDVAEVEFKRSKRYNRPLSAIMLDIDFFKIVNDTYSHAVGDRVLVQLSRLLIAELRESDIRARIGGEEFIVLLPETNQSLAQSLAERLRKSIADMVVDVDGVPVKITISLGIACLDSSSKTLDDLLHLSDLALFQAKRNGRNQVAIWKKPT
jgi:diguanylate cyclase (GGDEF)-like protein